MKNVFEMMVNGVNYWIFNGGYKEHGKNLENSVVALEVDGDGELMILKEDGLYESKSGIRKAIKKMMESEHPVDDEPETEEAEIKSEEADEQTHTEEEIVNTINEVIYRNLPKYVQRAIDYCDYVDGVYRIHLNTEFGSREIRADRWATIKASAIDYCKTGATALTIVTDRN